MPGGINILTNAPGFKTLDTRMYFFVRLYSFNYSTHLLIILDANRI